MKPENFGIILGRKENIFSHYLGIFRTARKEITKLSLENLLKKWMETFKPSINSLRENCIFSVKLSMSHAHIGPL